MKTPTKKQALICLAIRVMDATRENIMEEGGRFTASQIDDLAYCFAASYDRNRVRYKLIAELWDILVNRCKRSYYSDEAVNEDVQARDALIKRMHRMAVKWVANGNKVVIREISHISNYQEPRS